MQNDKRKIVFTHSNDDFPSFIHVTHLSGKAFCLEFKYLSLCALTFCIQISQMHVENYSSIHESFVNIHADFCCFSCFLRRLEWNEIDIDVFAGARKLIALISEQKFESLLIVL